MPATPVDSKTTVDLNASYRLGTGHGWLDNTQLSISVVNVFNELPPFVNKVGGYDAANGTVLGR